MARRTLGMNASRNVEEDEQSDIGFDPYEFANVIGDEDQPLYPGSKLLILQGDLLLEGNTLPSSMYEARKTLSALGMSYEKIHACPNDCILYRKDYEDSTNCPTCGVSRWKEGKDSILKEGAPAKVLTVKCLIQRIPHLGNLLMINGPSLVKNVCDSIIGTLLEIPGKNKDGIAARLDLLNMGVKTNLQPEYGQRRTRLPPGPWNLSRVEKRVARNSFYGMKVPKGYCSNIKNLVSLKDSGLLGLKSHDCHTLVQQLLPVAIRSVLEKPARDAITRLCFFFNAICAKTVDVSKLDKLEEDVVVTLCLLEKYFPPSFFDVMVHLVVHLVKEVRLCGPVYFRWMYPFERYMKVLKGYVQNRTRLEGCIIEQYIAEEAVEFCTEHLSDISTVGVPSSQKMGVSKPLSGCTVSLVDRDLLNQAHLYVLENTEEVLPYIECKEKKVAARYKHNSTFIQWLHFKVQSELNREKHNGVSENLRWLAAGPSMAVPSYRSYLITGVKFNTKAQDDV
ncbi:unnamed protein product [Prunus armeniaca]